MKLQGYLFILGLSMVNTVYADAMVKLLSDKNDSEVFVNGEIVGTYIDMPLEFILPPGTYQLEVKKDYKDQSYGYYSKEIKVGSLDIKMPINAVLLKEYSEQYYYKNASSISGAEVYLKKHPTGKYVKAVSKNLEVEYAKKAVTIKGAETYLEKYPSGKFSKRIKKYLSNSYAIKKERDILVSEITSQGDKIIEHLNSRAFNYKIVEQGYGSDKARYTSRATRVSVCKIKVRSTMRLPTHPRLSDTTFITDEYTIGGFWTHFYYSIQARDFHFIKNDKLRKSFAKKCKALRALDKKLAQKA